MGEQLEPWGSRRLHGVEFFEQLGEARVLVVAFGLVSEYVQVLTDHAREVVEGVRLLLEVHVLLVDQLHLDERVAHAVQLEDQFEVELVVFSDHFFVGLVVLDLEHLQLLARLHGGVRDERQDREHLREVLDDH